MSRQCDDDDMRACMQLKLLARYEIFFLLATARVAGCKKISSCRIFDFNVGIVIYLRKGIFAVDC